VWRAILRRDCTFASTARFRRARRFAGRGALAVRATFEGNEALLPRSAPRRTVAVRAKRPAAG
jgi:hypothetical protein